MGDSAEDATIPQVTSRRIFMRKGGLTTGRPTAAGATTISADPPPEPEASPDLRKPARGGKPGEETTVEQFPYHAIVVYQKLRLYCSGVIITIKHVMTAASCLGDEHTSYKPEKMLVYVGAMSGSMDEMDYTFNVITTDTHPNFKALENGFNYNIGVVEVDKYFYLGAKVQIAMLVNLKKSQYLENLKNKGAECTIVGWGSEKLNLRGPQGYRSYLRLANLRLVGNKSCQNYSFDPNQQLCTESIDDEGACLAHSGTGLLCPSETEQRIWGVASHFNSCDHTGDTVVFTRVDTNYEFIVLSTINHSAGRAWVLTQRSLAHALTASWVFYQLDSSGGMKSFFM